MKAIGKASNFRWIYSMGHFPQLCEFTGITPTPWAKFPFGDGSPNPKHHFCREVAKFGRSVFSYYSSTIPPALMVMFRDYLLNPFV